MRYLLARHDQICVHHGLEDADLPRVLIAEVLSFEPLFLLAVGESTEPGRLRQRSDASLCSTPSRV